MTLGACREIAILLRRTISGHLRRSRLEKILTVLQRIRLRFFRTCGLASGPTSIRLVTKEFPDRLLRRVDIVTVWALLSLNVLLFPVWAFGEKAVQPQSANPAVLPEKIKQEQETLENIQRKLKERKAEVKNATTRESSLLGKIKGLDRKLDTTRRDLTRVSREVEEKQKERTRIVDTLQSIHTEVEARRDSIRDRLRMLYMADRLEALQPVIATKKSERPDPHRRYLSTLAALEYDVVRTQEEKATALRGKMQRNEETTYELLDQKRDMTHALDSVKSVRETKQRLVAKTRDERAVHERTIAELERAASRVEALIRELQSERERTARLKEAGDGLGRAKGLLQWPADGEVVAYFGRQKHPRFDTYLQRKGIDIKAAQGSRIRSAYDGVVAYADWLKGYGLLIIIDHGVGDVSLYAHASSLLVKAGDVIKAGQPIGVVGDTDFEGEGMLYFEVRTGGNAVDPLVWLAKKQ